MRDIPGGGAQLRCPSAHLSSVFIRVTSQEHHNCYRHAVQPDIARKQPTEDKKICCLTSTRRAYVLRLPFTVTEHKK
jgi:hypothetical protein